VSSTDILTLVYLYLPAAFFIDLLVFTGAVWIAKVRA
jgi:hypothetical protein